MMSWCQVRFFLFVLPFFFFVLAHAVYDPREATTKPPKRRELLFPWHSADKVDSGVDLSRSPKWQVDPDNSNPKKPYVVEVGTKTWTPWKKNPGSEIEQRTEVEDQGQTNLDQQDDFSLEYSQFEQQSNRRFPQEPSGFSDQEGKRKDGGPKRKGPGENSLPIEPKDDQDLYEGVPADSQKPRKEKILVSTKPKSTVARYDTRMGVQCPEFDSTGQFVYPPDCKFFVNCWKGRAFVQPCAPGTLFNPDTLECDFPHKVKCYGGEVADFSSNEHLDFSGKREPLAFDGYLDHGQVVKLRNPKCPPHVTGLLAHPSECTKFLQCANGGTYIMDCGPGTVFNPAISVCDWPNNVRGCEDALKSEEEATTPLVHPDSEYYDHILPSEHRATSIVKCPSDFTGLLPHPDTCTKFLQCANGGTFVMDCGPGTAFNPSISVCDWPYNVPSCKKDKQKQHPVGTSTTVRPWSTHSSSGSWQHNHPHHRPGYHSTYPSGHPTTTPPSETDWSLSRPTWKPNLIPHGYTTAKPPGSDWDSSRPTWTPTRRPVTWTVTVSPPYTQTDYQNGDEQNRYNGYDQWSQTQSSVYPQSQWQPQTGEEKPNSNGGYHHHYHQHTYSHGQTYSPDRNTETQQFTPPFAGQSSSQKPDQNVPQTGNWDSNHGQHHYHYHHHHHGTPDEQHSVSNNGWNPEEIDPQIEQQSSRDHDYVPSNRRIDQASNRQDHGRISPDFSRPGTSHSPSSDRRIYVNKDYRVPGHSDSVHSWNKTTWTPILSSENRSVDHSWSQQGLSQTSTQNRPWDQDNPNVDVRIQNSGSEINNSRKTDDKEVDTRLDLLGTNTNVFLQNKPPHRPGIKNGSPNSSSSGIHVNVNGTRGHFITKEIEVNQGHSKTMTYRPNDIQSSNKFNNNDQNIYVDSAATNIDRMPPLVLQPPLYKPNNNGFALNNFSQGQNHSSIGRGHRTLKQYWPNNPSSMDPDDLTESGSNYHRAAVPSTSFQPPYPPVDRPSISTFLLNLSANSYYPPIPSTNMQPPPHGNPSFPIGWQYPPIPAAELQPPFFEPPPRTMDHRNNPNVYLRPTFHPSDRFPSSNFTSNATLRNVNVPVEKFPPFHPETSDNSRGTFDKVKNRTERVPGKEPTFPPKKRVMEITEKPEIETIKPNVPKDLTEEENATEYPDILEPDFDKDVDVLVEKEIWKPVLVFENRTQTTTTTESSVIMKINKKKVDVDLFNIEAAPFEKEEPPFPAYYIPSVAPLDHSKKATLPTPISGQIIRLRGGSGPHDGYVEVQGMNPGWGIVCDSRNSWTLKEANVICRQLGYSRGAEMAWQGRNNRNGMPNWIAANFVSCQGDEARFQSCKFKHEQVCRAERDAIGVRCVANRVAHCHKDEVPFEGQCYHLADPESGFNHAEALEYCAERNARLVDITSQDENDFISEWIIQKHSDVASIMTSGVGFTTLNRTLWLWEDSARAKFRFTKWWPGWMEDKKHPPFVGSRPLCLIMKRKFPCHERPDLICVADYFFWDTEDCAASGKGHSYICKRPYDDIGCIYGKGSQYGGTANVTASGKDCLSWGDPRIAHPLMMNVLNRDVREKLKSHNYCRNPNPNRENRPWCFTGPGGQRENCDIPPCGNIGKPKSLLAGKCKPKHFECLPGECIPSPWVCDGEEDCTNGADEKACTSHMDLFKKHSKYKLEGYDVQKWLNTPLKTCALRCKEADFTCRSFAHKAAGNICLLSDSNIGLSGSLKPNKEYDYYEMKERSVNCEGMFLCNNQKCVNQTQVCNGKNDCNDRSDENICTVENLDYDIRLADAENKHEGRIEVKILGIWGQVCDDGFGMIDADVICKELGFSLGALEVRPGGFYGNMDPPTRFMVDQLRCRGNETSLRECDFEGWGVHNCQPEEAVGVVCKTAVDSCQDGHWKCDKSPMCIPTAFICDEVVDCPDGSDESSEHCDAPFEIRLANGSSPLEGRVEVRHHGIWGTVCDDDFSNATAAVICRSLGYGGRAIAKKDGYFGPGEGPIWLDEVFCYGNETQLYRCDHNHWGQHNCNHDEDAGVICTSGDVSDSKLYWENAENIPELNINDILPSNCGRRYTGFNEDEDFILEKVVRGTIAPKGSYPWQASIRVRGHSRSNHWCGAVILSSLHVLTAAHCLQGYNKGTYFVRAGDYNTEIDEESEAEANIEDYYIHEDFRKGHRMNNDIAVVLLKGRGIPLGKDIVPICLPPENAEYPPGLNCTISGFGSIETGKSTHSKDLRYGWIPLLDQSVCRAGHVYGEGAISDGMVCAGHLDEGIDTCDGDSGGPLACINNGAFTLYGITSWGQHCGRANKPGVYVRVSHYRQWIDKKIKESLSGR